MKFYKNKGHTLSTQLTGKGKNHTDSNYIRPSLSIYLYFPTVIVFQIFWARFVIWFLENSRWDERMSIIIPDDEEDMFYTVGLLYTTESDDDLSRKEKQNKEILEFCYKSGIKIKQYFPHYGKKGEWMKHFGKKWSVFQENKAQFDPKMILSPGQRIYSSD